MPPRPPRHELNYGGVPGFPQFLSTFFNSGNGKNTITNRSAQSKVISTTAQAREFGTGETYNRR